MISRIIQKLIYKRSIHGVGLAFLLAALLLAGCNKPMSSEHKTIFYADGSCVEPELSSLLDKIEPLSLPDKKQALQFFRLSFANSYAKQEAAYVLARLLKQEGTTDNLKQAISLFKEAGSIPPLAPRCYWHISECANTLGKEKIVRNSLTSLLEITAEPEAKAQIHYALCQSYMRTSETAHASELFKTIIEEAPDSQFALGARYYLGQMALDNKDLPSNLSFWHDYLKVSPDGRFAYQIVNSLYKDNAAKLTKDDHNLFASVNYAYGNWDGALKEWDLSGNKSLWFKQAVCLLHLAKTAQAKKLLISSIKSHSNDGQVTEAALYLAKTAPTKQEAFSIWHTVLSCCPKFKDIALYNLAIRSNDRQALSYYQQIVKNFPKSKYAPEATWWLAWTKIKSGKIAEALSLCKTGANKYSSALSAPRFNFWTGKLYERLKQKPQAIKSYKETAKIFGHHYYGWRAQARCAALENNKDNLWSLNTEKHLAYCLNNNKRTIWSYPLPPYLISYQLLNNSIGQTMSCLAELHQWDECLELIPNNKVTPLRALCLAKLSLIPDSINLIAKDLKGKPDQKPAWQLSYPLLYTRFITKEAASKNNDPFLVQALIREESRYNPQAVSNSNALGLMQLLPTTAFSVAKNLGISLHSNFDIEQPETNIKLGVYYLSGLLQRFKGNAMLAVASYNGGPNAVESWTKHFKMPDLDYFVENIPFPETRNYVRKVFGSYWNYAEIYQEDRK